MNLDFVCVYVYVEIGNWGVYISNQELVEDVFCESVKGILTVVSQTREKWMRIGWSLRLFQIHI